MTLPSELKHCPLGQLYAVLSNIRYRHLPTRTLDLSDDSRENETLIQLWRHDYVVLRDDLVLDQGEQCSLADLRLSAEGEELLERVWAEYRLTLPVAGDLRRETAGR
jgi:hypothetical protein